MKINSYKFESARIPFITIPTQDGPKMLYLVTKKGKDGTIVQVRMGPKLIGTLGITGEPGSLRTSVRRNSKFINKYLVRFLNKIIEDANILPFEKNSPEPTQEENQDGQLQQ